MGNTDILIIDDSPANLKLLAVLLAAEGFVVHSAPDAATALVGIGHTRPKLILTDIQLPGMSGLELTRTLKADPRWRHIPVVAVTAYAANNDRDAALEAGCEAYVSKPIDTRALPQLLRSLLGQV